MHSPVAPPPLTLLDDLLHDLILPSFLLVRATSRSRGVEGRTNSPLACFVTDKDRHLGHSSPPGLRTDVPIPPVWHFFLVRVSLGPPLVYQFQSQRSCSVGAMASHTKKDDFCLECHWEAFHLDGKETEDPAGAQPDQWNCPDQVHTPLPHCEVDEQCHVDEDCCDVDDCSVNCSSVCDGFVDCEEALVCSESHCNEDHCKNVDPVCFDEHCFDGSNVDGEHSLESLLGLGSPLNLEANDLLSPTTITPSQGEQPKTVIQPTGGLVAPASSNDTFLNSYAAPVSHCHSHSHQHFHCHDFSKDAHHAANPWLPLQNAVNPADVFHMVACPDLSGCHQFHVHEAQACPVPDKPADDTVSNPFTCFHIPHIPHHHHHPTEMKSPALPHKPTNNWKPCRTHVHRCRTHGHAHVHPYAPYSPYSRHSRSSVSSQLSPGETPPPLDGGTSSVLTSPEYAPDTEVFMCQWATTTDGVKMRCGATFADACALQEHLVGCHMATVEGAKGTGYYCCWAGCHRPDEPFSQKSKLQGHFLTHSNCECLFNNG